jgi:hypothetical protein
MSYQRHPLSAAWPNMSPEEYASLIESIQMHGQRDPIVLLDDQILDGWHRYRACLDAGMEPMFTAFEGDDPKDFVSDKHNRRSLSITQRMTAIALMSQWAPSGAAGHKSKGSPGDPLTTNDLAKKGGGSRSTAKQVKAALTTGHKEVVKAMQDGELSAKRAAQISKLPSKDQVKAITAPKEADDEIVTTHDLIADMEETQQQNAQLEEKVAAMSADDKAAEIDKLLTRVHGLEGRVSQLMTQLHASEKREKSYATTFHKLRKLLKVESHAEILRAVEGLASESA